MKQTISTTLFFILIGIFSSVTYAAEPTSSPYLLLAKNTQSLNSAAQSIKQQTGGRILSTKTIIRNGKRIHKIKVLLPSGKVRIFKIKAN